MLAAVAMFAWSPTEVHAAGGIEPSRGVVRVKLQPEVAKVVAKSPRMKAPGSKASVGVESLDNALSLIDGVRIEPMLPPNPLFAAERAKYGLDQWYVVHFDETISPNAIRKQFTDVAGVLKAEVVKPMIRKEGSDNFRVAENLPAAKAPGKYPFNDPRLPEQWHYQNYGTSGQAVAGADINLFDAWDITTGNKNVVVAIIDGGVDYTHEDLAANMYVNEAELNGTEGVDDDKNGYVDDIYGYNFCTNTGLIYPHNHGTHVAGTVAAVNNNGKGVCGVAGGDGTPDSGVKLLSCQVFDSRQGTSDGDFAKAIVYAREKGATLAQCSWGWSEPGYYEQAVLDAIDYFTAEAKSANMTGGLMIFAAGNEGLTGDYYPGCYDKVVSVAAMSNDLRPTSYSCYGDWVDVIAPGGLLDFGESEGILSTLPGNKYGFNEGTSMATPHVSGIAALILSKYGSTSFTNEILRTQLITSVNDFYGYKDGINEQFRGQYGSGYVDAYKALQMGDGSAPETVTDFTLQAAQDYIIVEWTIPAASDDNVHNHIIYYSTEPFTAASDLSKIKSVVADTKFYTSGAHVSKEISGLTSLTKYYVAIQAVSRWGAASELSAVKEIQTNEGPKMVLSTKNHNLTSQNGSIRHGAFTISNDADGILKWSSANTLASAKPSTYSVVRPTRPNVGRLAQAYNGKIEGLANTATTYSTVASDYIASEYPKTIKYYSTYYAVIGDSDTSLPNSMAQFFWVDPEVYPDGFNLTSVVTDFTYGKNPKIEIYKGSSSITSATKIQDVDASQFVYKQPVALNEQIYFAPNESFWIVVHFEGNQESWSLPVALFSSEYSYVGSYSYMSNDMGQTWVSLQKALVGSTYEPDAAKLTWGVWARSDNPDFSEVLILDPAKGTVAPHEKQTVNASVDGSKLVNGTYKFNLALSTNETGKELVTLPVNVTIKGNPADIQVPKVVDFGSLLVGESKTLTVEVFNNGFGPFAGSGTNGNIPSKSISSTSEHFKGPGQILAGVPARSYQTFEVTYTPKAAGSHTGTIVVKDYQGKEFSVIVRGVATDPSKLALEPAVVDAGTLTVGGESKEVSFKVVNQGNYPLEYVFPKFSKQTIENKGNTLHQYGYLINSNIEGYNPGFEYSAPEQLVNAVDVRPQLSDNAPLSEPISMGFEFPFYGENYDKVYITSYGALSFGVNEISLWSPLSPKNPERINGMGIISAYGNLLNFGANSQIKYAKQDGKFIVSYENVLGLVYESQNKPISFRIVLSRNGDVEMYYDDYIADDMFQDGSTLFCGLSDKAVSDYIEVTSTNVSLYKVSSTDSRVETDDNQRYRKFNTGTAVKYSAPKPSFVSALDKPYGMVNPGESVEVKATLEAKEGLDAGATSYALAIVTNDPNPTVGSIVFNAVIDGDLVAEAALEDSAIDLGDVFRTSDSKAIVTVKNNGHNTLTVTNVNIEGAGLTLSPITLPFELAPRSAKDVYIVVDTESSRAIDGTVTISTSTGDLTATVKANVIGVPVLELSADAFNEEVTSGENLHRDLTIANRGNEPLTYSITPTPIVKMAFPENETSSITYKYEYSEDENDVEFDWIDVETTGLGEHTALSYYNLHDFITVPLDFEFPFYGERYDTIFVYNTGFVSFTRREDQNAWPEPPADYPSGSIYTNMIAPYWGLHSPNTTNTSGTYHYITEDRAVISFMEFGNSMNSGVCFQLILEKDGTFKFQYKPNSGYSQIQAPYGLAGICNKDGSESIRMQDYQIKFNTATLFSPITKATIEPGKSETIGLDFETARMDGTYTGTIKVATNVPGKENVNIPVSLKVNGVADPVWPDSIYIEHPIGYIDYQDPARAIMASYSALLPIVNAGTGAFYIAGVEFESPKFVDPDYPQFGEEDMFMLCYYAEANSGVDPMANDLPSFSDANKAWTPYYNEPLKVGTEPIYFMVPMYAESPAGYTPGEYNLTVRIYYTLEEDSEDFLTKDLKITFKTTEVPVLSLDQRELRIKADSENDVISKSFKIANTGDYKLSYSLVLDATGVGEEIPEIPEEDDMYWAPAKKVIPTELAELSAPNAAAKIKPLDDDSYVDSDFSRSAFDLPRNFTYTDALYYPYSTGTAYQYGSTNIYDIYKAATHFVAPEGGFNISHLYTAVDVSTCTNYGVKFELVLGDDPDGKDIIGTANLLIEGQEDPYVGQFFVVALDKPVYLNEGEAFTVVVTYSAGSLYPAYVCPKEEQWVSDRYQGWVENYGWFDLGALFKESYGSLGYILTCLETTEGQPWVRLLSADNGVVEVDENAEIKVEVNASSARLEKNNKAVLVIKSNDINEPIINFPIYLDCNSRPTITTTESVVATKENESVEIPVSVYDEDGDDVTVSLTDNFGFAKITSYTVAEGDAAVVTANEDGTYLISGATAPVNFIVTIAPDFGTASTGNAFSVNATDSNGHKSEVSVRYDIEFVNRAPVTKGIEEITIAKGSLSDIISFDTLFEDPDGDKLTYKLSLARNNYVEAFTTSSGVIFNGLRTGYARATITATDPYEESVELRLRVNVSDETGVDGVIAENGVLTVMPNPVEDWLNAQCGFTATNVEFTLYGVNGAVLAQETADVVSGDSVRMNVVGVPAGNYILTAVYDGNMVVARVVKR